MHKTLTNLAVTIVMVSGVRAHASGEIVWGDSFDKAKTTAQSEGKLLFVDFWRDN